MRASIIFSANEATGILIGFTKLLLQPSKNSTINLHQFAQSTRLLCVEVEHYEGFLNLKTFKREKTFKFLN